MEDRKKKGIGFMISGAVFLTAGIVMYAFTATPEWLNVVVQLAGAASGVKPVFISFVISRRISPRAYKLLLNNWLDLARRVQ